MMQKKNSFFEDELCQELADRPQPIQPGQLQKQGRKKKRILLSQATPLEQQQQEELSGEALSLSKERSPVSPGWMKKKKRVLFHDTTMEDFFNRNQKDHNLVHPPCPQLSWHKTKFFLDNLCR